MSVATVPPLSANTFAPPRIRSEAVGASLKASIPGIRAVLFDVDGVIADTAHLHAAAWRRLASEEGLPFDDGQADAVRGVSREASLDIVLGSCRIGASQRIEWMNRKNRYYRDSLNGLSVREILPGVITLLDDLARLGIQIAAVSASRNARTVLDRLDLACRFDVIIDGHAALPPGAESNRYQAAATAIGVHAKECVVIEDSAKGVETASAIGMRTVGIGAFERLAGADLVFESLSGVRGDTLLRWLGTCE